MALGEKRRIKPMREETFQIQWRKLNGKFESIRLKADYPKAYILTKTLSRAFKDETFLLTAASPYTRIWHRMQNGCDL